MKSKKLPFLILAALLLTAFPVSAQAAASTEERVFDYAQLFTETERESLQSAIDEHIAEYAMDVVVLTTKDDSGKSPRAFADDFYDNYGFGYGRDNAGVLFLVNTRTRDLYISTAGRMIDILNDGRIDAILNTQYEYARDGNYYDAMMAAIAETGAYIGAGPVSGQYRYHEDRYLAPWWVAVSIIIGVGAALITVVIIKKTYSREYKPVPYDYRNESRLNLTLKTDDLIDKRVSRRYDPPPPDHSGGSSGRSTTHTSGSGSLHGGGGRRF
jgi:uncharacterized protein